VSLANDPRPVRFQLLKADRTRGVPTVAQRRAEREEAMRARATMFGENAAVTKHKAECRDFAARAIGVAIILIVAIVIGGIYIRAGIALWNGFPK
jgi:hypothetical protein